MIIVDLEAVEVGVRRKDEIFLKNQFVGDNEMSSFTFLVFWRGDMLLLRALFYLSHLQYYSEYVFSK